MTSHSFANSPEQSSGGGRYPCNLPYAFLLLAVPLKLVPEVKLTFPIQNNLLRYVPMIEDSVESRSQGPCEGATG